MHAPSTTDTDRTLALSLLGPFAATSGGQPVHFATDATRALLAYLAVESSRPHRREHLATLLWPDQSQAAALTNLRQTLARLRRGLSQPVAGRVLMIARQTLEIRTDSIDLDCAQFEALVSACAEHAHRDLVHCRACIQRLEQAHALYRGDFLNGVFPGVSQLFDEWTLARREQFQRQALNGLQTLTQHYEAVADFDAMRRSAERQLALEPWLEEAHRQLMRALALQGQRSAALAQYEECRRVLGRELSVEPELETRALYERIRDGELVSQSLRAPAPVHNLPAQLAAFVGRETELAEIQARLDDPDARLLTLVGAGGMGKTRLAIEAASRALSRFPDGVFFVSLAPLVAPDGVAAAIATAMGLTLTGDVRQALPFALRDKRVLLVLDNFEHLLDGAGTIVGLLEAAPSLQLIATSRERLNVLGEHVYVVLGMEYGPAEDRGATPAAAARLFAQSARRVHPDFTLQGKNLEAVARICELVEGMPLGLELAAAWADMLPLADIAREIEQSIDFLASDWRDTPARHRSLRAVFDGSWRALDDPERQVFRRLSVFRGGFTRDAAGAVAGASLRVLARLARKSLLYQQGGRYQIHELLRQFGAEQLDLSPDERADVEARHSANYLTLVAKRQTALDGEEARQAAEQLRAEIDNITKAWTSAVGHDRITDLDESAIGLWRFASLTGSGIDIERLMRLAAEQLESYLHHGTAEKAAGAQRFERVLSKVRALQAAALVARGDFDAAIPVADQAITRGRSSQGLAGEALGYLGKGQALVQKARYAEAQQCLERALHRAQGALRGDASIDSLDLIEFPVYLWLGSIAIRQSAHARAGQLFRKSLDICRERGDLRGEMHCLANLGNAARTAQSYAPAREHYEHGLRLARQLSYRWGEAATQLELGDIARLQGDPELARELIERALVLYREIGDRMREAVSLAYLGRLHVYLGDDAGAREYLERFLDVSKGIDAPFAEDWGCVALAVRHYHAGAAEQALDYAQRAVAAAELVGSRVDHADALVVMAQILAALGRPAESTRAYQQGLDLCDGVDGASEAVTARAGLAQIALDRHDETEARAHIDKLLATLAEHPDGCVDQPGSVYLTCYRVLDSLGDSRAPGLLHDAHRRLLTYADGIADDGRRRSFLENVTAHRELRQAYADRFESNSAGTRSTGPQSRGPADLE